MIYNFTINSVIEKNKKLKLVAEYIKEKKKINKNYKVIDIGGGVMNKGDIDVDCLFDLNNTHSIKKISLLQKI